MTVYLSDHTCSMPLTKRIEQKVSGQLTPFRSHPIFFKDISPHVKFHSFIVHMFGTIVISKHNLFSFKVY